MRRLLLAVMLSFVAVACGGKTSPATSPTTPPVANASAPLTEASLTELLAGRFAAQVADGRLALDFGSSSVALEVVDELAALGITTVGQLAAIIPPDFATKGFGAMQATVDATTNLAGLTRDLMIIHDARRYVATAWQNHWSASGPEDFPAPAAYGVDFQILVDGGVFGGGTFDDDPGELESDPGDGAD